MRILVVDDNTDAADSLAELLTIMGHEVQSAYNGESALRAASELRPMLVLLDLAMPGMDGCAVARELRQSGLQAYIVAVTGFGQPADVAMCLDNGFDRHLLKPAAPSDLIEAIRFAASTFAVA